jgi:hypothetical protein
MSTWHQLDHVCNAGIACVLLAVLAVPAAAVDSTRVKALFANPPREYSSAPFWVWNDLLTDQQVLTSLREFADQGIRQVFVHPRPGLMTPYLGDDWFRLWKLALDEAERLDMNLWIYDENSYPSGFAGGWVPELMPQSRGRGLVFEEVRSPPRPSDELVAVFRATEDQFEDVTNKVHDREPLPEDRYLIASVQRAGNSPWFGGRCYVDLLYPGVTEKFLSVTLDPYEKHVGSEFGRRVPGVFTDEPHLRPAGGLPWTDDLPEQFERRWGYSLLAHLPSLERQLGDWRRVRHNYYQALLDLFIERWAQPYYEYCEQRGLEFTGHYWEHEWPRCGMGSDNMAMYAWQQRPAIDTLMNEYNEGTHAQFGNARAVKELSSVANQLGRGRTLCEAYGAGGWDLRFEDMKRIGDWLYVLGVNTLNQHLSYVTIRGMRKRDHPPSFTYHEPWWEAYHVLADYFARLSVALSQGEQVNHILLLEPTSSAWMYQGADTDARLDEIGDAFQRVVLDLEQAQIEYDLGCEDILARHGSAQGSELVVGQRQYTLVVLPPHTENLNRRTTELLDGFLKQGGAVLCCGEPPTRVDGHPSDWGALSTEHPGWQAIEADVLPRRLMELSREGFAVRSARASRGLLFHHRRQLDDGQIVFLVNTSIDSPASGLVSSRAGGVEQWELDTGEVRAYPFEVSGDVVLAKFELPPSGSLLLFLSDEQREPVPARVQQISTIDSRGPLKTRRHELNVLVLDYADVIAGGDSRESAYVLTAADFAFKKNGLERNPWSGAVQFRDEIISRTFPAGSGFEAVYRFTVGERVPTPLFAVVERADLYTITCNGVPVSAAQDAWWLDRSFGKIDIAAAARVGENEIRIKASPFTVFHELESAYVLGDFALEAAEAGFVIVPPRELDLGRWNEQGHPFYSAGVGYVEEFVVSNPSGEHRVACPSWYGSVAKVNVNGEPAGLITAPPWECDVTPLIRRGANEIEVVVIGTLKNTLGPHHGKPPLGRAWPGMFEQAPETGPPAGGDYATVGYGLFEPFVLKRVVE